MKTHLTLPYFNTPDLTIPEHTPTQPTASSNHEYETKPHQTTLYLTQPYDYEYETKPHLTRPYHTKHHRAGICIINKKK